MKLERTKNTKRNIVTGMIYRMLNILLPLLLRTIMLRSIGIEYLGANSLFNSVISVLNLAELGFGTSIVFYMYKPIAEGDDEKLCALLNLYKKVYFLIGSAILAIGFCITPFIPKLITGTIPNGLNVNYVYWIHLVSTASTYFVFAYKEALLNAYQRNDIGSITHSILSFVEYVVQIVLMVLYNNYYVYLLVIPAFNIIYNLIISFITSRMYPTIKANGSLLKEEKKSIAIKVKSLFIYKVGGVVSNSVDNLYISAFSGLAILAIYNNYYYVISALFLILNVYYNSMLAGLGNKIAIEDKKSNYDLFNNLFFVQGWMIGWMAICLLCLFQDFTKLVYGKAYLLDFYMIILFCIYFYTWKINDIAHIYKDAAGLWEKDRYRPLIASVFNLLINALLITRIGISAVLISTIFCEVVFSMFWGVRVLYKYYFEIDFKKYISKYLLYMIITVAVSFLTYLTCSIVSTNNNLINLIIKGIICLIIPNAIVVLTTKNTDGFKWIIGKIFEKNKI